MPVDIAAFFGKNESSFVAVSRKVRSISSARGQAMGDSAVSVDDLVFSYGSLRVIDGMSLEVPRGISFGLLGANGAGKTTLIRLMVGLLKPASGHVLCLGQPPSRANASQIGYMPQMPSLYSELTVQQNIDFFAHIYGLKHGAARRERVNEVIKLIELWEKRNTSVLNLSGGMRQRVSLGCAIVHKPALIFLDEPTVGLDIELRLRFWEYFDSLTKQGTTLIISSHTMDDAAHCQGLAFMREGKVIASGSPADLKAATGRPDASLEEAFVHHIRAGGSRSVL
jgi:ABC-2 type transport system ATP-binding protein